MTARGLATRTRVRLTSWPAVVVLAALGIVPPANARADSDVLRFKKTIDNVEISVFTPPPPIRAGTVDINVLVRPDPPNARVPAPVFQICAYPVGFPEKKRRADNVLTPSLDKMFTAAELQIPAPGRWQVEVDADIVNAERVGEFEIDVEEPSGRLGLWIGLPLAVIVIFVAHRWLVHRRHRRVVRPASSGIAPS
jgi:hypothetical protein